MEASIVRVKHKDITNKIFSDGQTVSDQAVLDAAIKSCYDFMKRGYAALFGERLKFLSQFEFIPRCKQRGIQI